MAYGQDPMIPSGATMLNGLRPISLLPDFHAEPRPPGGVRLIIQRLANHCGHTVTATVSSRQDDEELLRLP